MKKKHLIAGSCSLLVVLSLATWIYSRYDVWFGNPPEKPYLPPQRPERVLLTFGTGDEWTRNVSWQCDSVVRKAFVRLTEEEGGDTLLIPAEGETFRSRNGVSAYYVARLRALKPATAYRYQACTDGKESPWYGFRTQPASSNRAISFLYMGDVQDTLGGKANLYLKAALQRHPETEFLTCGGDIVERPMDSYWGELFRGVDSIGQTLPLLTVTGNHDYLKGVIQKLERRFSLVFSYFLDSMIGENQVFTLRYGNLQLFCLDSNRELPYLLEQKQWLESKLKESCAQWKVVILHHPLYSIMGAMNNLIQRYVFDDLLREEGVDLVLQAHEHAYARMTAHRPDGTAQPPVYTVSHCSPKHYRIRFDKQFDKYGISGRYYQLIRLEGDTLTVATHDAYTGSLYDKLQLVKPEGKEAQIIDLGKEIPEYLEFHGDPKRKKNQRYLERIREYKQWRGIATE